MMERGQPTLDRARNGSTRVAYWTRRMAEVAPEAPWLFVQPYIHLLAGCAGPDVLLVAADALDQAAEEARLRDDMPRGCVLFPRAVAGLLRDEAPRRA